MSVVTDLRSSAFYSNATGLMQIDGQVKDRPSLLSMQPLPRLKTAESLGDLLRQKDEGASLSNNDAQSDSHGGTPSYIVLLGLEGPLHKSSACHASA